MCNCVQINLIAPPRYVMTTTTLERTEGLSVLNQAMAAIKEKIEEKRGVFNIQMEVIDINTAQICFLVFHISTVQHKKFVYGFNMATEPAFNTSRTAGECQFSSRN